MPIFLLKLSLISCLTTREKFEIYQKLSQHAQPMTTHTIFQFIPRKKRTNFLHSWRALTPKKLQTIQLNNHFITIEHSLYPTALKEIYDPPLVLFYQGDLSLLTTPMLTIVGTRQPSQYSYNVLRSLLPPLIRQNLTIVTGISRGIHTYACKQTLALGGFNIAIIGCGIDHVYPKENDELQAELCMNQLVLSEYPRQTPAKKSYLVSRNRLLAGISQAILVVEAQSTSIPLITANFALNYGREVFAVPGSILRDSHSGCFALIHDGAKLVTNAQDILEELQP